MRGAAFRRLEEWVFSRTLQLAEQASKRTAVHLFGSLENMARRLLESLRCCRWADDCFDPDRAAALHIRLIGLTAADTSSPVTAFLASPGVPNKSSSLHAHHGDRPPSAPTS